MDRKEFFANYFYEGDTKVVEYFRNFHYKNYTQKSAMRLFKSKQFESKF